MKKNETLSKPSLQLIDLAWLLIAKRYVKFTVSQNLMEN